MKVGRRSWSGDTRWDWRGGERGKGEVLSETVDGAIIGMMRVKGVTVARRSGEARSRSTVRCVSPMTKLERVESNGSNTTSPPDPRTTPQLRRFDDCANDIIMRASKGLNGG